MSGTPKFDMQSCTGASGIFRGLPVYVEPLLTVSQPRRLSRWERFRLRTERLFSWVGLPYPFRLVATMETVPNPGIYVIDGFGFMMHPTTWAGLKEWMVSRAEQ